MRHIIKKKHFCDCNHKLLHCPLEKLHIQSIVGGKTMTA